MWIEACKQLVMVMRGCQLMGNEIKKVKLESNVSSTTRTVANSNQPKYTAEQEQAANNPKVRFASKQREQLR